MGLAIRHRIDASIIYISRNDSVWDKARIDAELDACGSEGSPWASSEDHPWTRYLAGKSRFDIATVREYMRPDEQPIEFKLRRMGLRDWVEIEELIGRGRLAPARAKAIALSLESVTGLDWKPGRKRHDEPIADELLDALRGMITDAEFIALGYACINANMSLTDEEKRPFVSSRGD
jgi:hypothetical protein